MDADVQEQVTFHLTGRRPATGLGAVEGLDVRPAALARYRDLAGLRYDYPLVLVERAAAGSCLVSLSGVFDGLLTEAAQDHDADRLRHQALRLEREIRTGLEAGAEGTLSSLWEKAERALGETGDAVLVDGLARLRAARRVDGEVVGCDQTLPGRVLMHAWSAVERDKARTMRRAIDGPILKLSDILRADEANSEAGLSADRLRASVGSPYADEIDFGAMSRLLTTARPVVRLSASRRRRIQELLATLEGQTLYPSQGRPGDSATPGAYGFVFHSCRGAVEAYRERLPSLVALAKAMIVAGLEIKGQYQEHVHDAMFEALGAEEIDPSELARFPDYLVCVRADDLDAAESATLTAALSAGLPMKVLLQVDDLMAPADAGDGHASAGARVRQLAHAAIGIGGVHVVQAASSQLYRVRERIVRGLECAGPALFSVYSGAGGALGGLPPYLAAAAAVESRAFPSFFYEPTTGADWASRFSLDENPQADRDWPLRTFTYEDESLQQISTDLAFTLVDFLACDARFARHFARVPRTKWNGNMIPVEEAVTAERQSLPGPVPYTLVVDAGNALHRLLVDAKLMREARRCRERWHSLQELGGIHNSHAERLLAKERQAWEERRRQEPVLEEQAAPAAGASAASAPVAAFDAEPAAQTRTNEPYIETPRCSSCDECVRINDRMFKYNQNKQAYIADLGAGTYAQLVVAAESCQVAIIHPGKPKNPNEPGLATLLERAEAFA